MQLCNNINEKKYKITIILIEADIYFFYLNKSTACIYYCRSNSWHSSSELVKLCSMKTFMSSV